MAERPARIPPVLWPMCPAGSADCRGWPRCLVWHPMEHIDCEVIGSGDSRSRSGSSAGQRRLGGAAF